MQYNSAIGANDKGPLYFIFIYSDIFCIHTTLHLRLRQLSYPPTKSVNQTSHNFLCPHPSIFLKHERRDPGIRFSYIAMPKYRITLTPFPEYAERYVAGVGKCYVSLWKVVQR